MIVTMMFAQVVYLLILYFGAWTRGDEGFVHPQQARALDARRLGSTSPIPRRATWRRSLLFAIVLVATLVIVRSRHRPRAGRHPRERGAHADAGLRHLSPTSSSALVVSGAICAAAGAAYAVLFGYVGSTFASVQYSILPLLWVLLGGAATTLGPLARHAVHVLSWSTSPAATPRPTC